MTTPKIIGAQRDFSSGELDEKLKRADELPTMKAGARQLVNFRLSSGGQALNRPGRLALALESGRVDEVLMGPGQTFFLAFGDGYLRVYNAAWTQVAQTYVKGDGVTHLPWTRSTANSIVFAVVPGPTPQVYITYGHDWPFNIPLVLTWDGVSQTSTWTIGNFAEAILGNGQKRTMFDRISKANVTIMPSATTGVVTLTASDAVFTAGMAANGCHLLWCGRELLIAGYQSPTQVTAQVLEQLPNTVDLSLGQFLSIGNGNMAFIPGQNGYFLPGDLVEGAISGARAIVVSTSSEIGIAGTAQNLFFAETPHIQAQVIPTARGEDPVPYFLSGMVGFTSYFTWQETIVGQNGNSQVGGTGLLSPSAVSIWDDEVMNNYRGWPTSVFYDQGRLGFCGFKGSPSAIAWSAIGLPNDFYVNGLASSVTPDNAIYEKAPGSSQVQYVVPGMESSEFVFCSDAIYYIPITTAVPLTPGSVSFTLLTSQGSYPNIKPVQIQQSIVYVRAGGASLGAVQTPGYYWRPNIIDLVSEFHEHLIKAAAPLTLAAPQAPNQYEETYVYLLRADGTILTARYVIRNGQIENGPEGKPKMGWLQWNGAGIPSWMSALGGDLIFTTEYGVTGDPWSSGFSNGFGGAGQAVPLVEVLDNTQYLDMAIAVNAPPAALTPPGGKGPLWFYTGQTVTLIDLGTRDMGTYHIDANGFLIPQSTPGENLSSLALVAGQPWTAVLEPFVPDAPPGQSAGQRMKRRRVSRMSVYVSNSTGFMLARLFSETVTPLSPAPGTIMNEMIIPMWAPGEDVTLPPPLREQAYRYRPSGRAFDPRVALLKGTPGPLLIHEIGFEVTI